MNEYDSNRIIDLVKLIGYERTNNQIEATCYVLNTCHIRNKATEKVYSEIGRIKKNFKNIKKPLVIVVGCVAQAESEEMLKRESWISEAFVFRFLILDFCWLFGFQSVAAMLPFEFSKLC